jgi:transmembrane sensor
MDDQRDYNEAIMLIIDEFEGVISNEQREKLLFWREQSVENERVYQEFHSIKIEVDVLAHLRQVNVDDSWMKVETRLAEQSKVRAIAFPEADPKPKLKFNLWMSVAASLVLFLGFYLYHQSGSLQTVATEKGGHARITLPDGSFVALNGETEIQFNKDNFAASRVLKLISGEAYLEVKHNSSHPFKVLVSDAVVEDLGTSFSVNRDNKSVKVFVSSGKVMFKASENGSSKLIMPQHAAALDLDTKRVNEIVSPEGQLNWVQQSLNFKNTNLSDIVSKLEKVYNTPVKLKVSALNERKLTANLSYQTLDSALSVISTSLQLKVQKVEGAYLITD